MLLLLLLLLRSVIFSSSLTFSLSLLENRFADRRQHISARQQRAAAASEADRTFSSSSPLFEN
jgi:hypothetical protein